MNITVKNVPESVYRVIKREAKNQRRSLNAQIIEALETEAAEVSGICASRFSAARGAYSGGANL